MRDDQVPAVTEAIINRILGDLGGRCGIGDELDIMYESTKIEMLEKWRRMINYEIRAAERSE